jgi:flagellin
MALAIATNTGALMAAASATSANRDMETSMERLSTGKRINSAKDDAAGVAIASRLSSEIRGTNQAIRNAQDGQALINTAEGAHKEIETILQRMRELAVQSSNDTNDSTDRANLQSEFSALSTEINRIAGATTWAGQELLTGAGGTDGDGAFNLQVGGNTGTVDTITVTISGMTTSDLGEDTEVEGSVSTDGVDVVTQVTNVAIDLDNVATVGDTTVLNIGSTAITYNAAAAGEDLATIVAGLTTAAAAASYTTATFSAGSDGASIDVTYAAAGVQTDSITLAATDGATAAVTTTGATTTTGVAAAAEVQTGDLSGVTFTGTGAIDAAISLTIGGSTFATTGTSFADAAALASDLNSVLNSASAGYTVSASSTNLILTATATGAVTDSFALSGGGTDSTAVAAAAFAETTAGVAAAAEVQNAALDVDDVAGIGDTVALTIGSGNIISYTTVAAGEDLATIVAGLTTAAAAASYTTATFSVGSDGTSIDVTWAATGAQTDTASLAATDAATAAVSTTGTTTTTAVTAVAQISSVDASSFEVEEGDVFTMVVGDVTLTYTASSSDTSISDVVTGLQTDDDYDSTVFTLTESSDTITATYATAEAQDDTTITIGKNLFDISDRDQATAMIDFMDEAIALVNTQRAELGAVSNRLDNTVSNLTSISINLEGGRGRIEDADFATESTSLAKSQILAQASTAMLAQANASKQSVLSLLQG